MTNSTLITHLLAGGLAVIPTDTIYGLVGIAKKPATIADIYTKKHRSPTKPLILLVSKISQISDFGVDLTPEIEKQLASYWPAPISILLPCPDPAFEYLHRGTNELAFRMPDKPDLLALIDATSSLAAPSANPESLPPAKNIHEAREYFGDDVIYIDGGTLDNPPSQLIRIHADGSVEKLR